MKFLGLVAVLLLAGCAEYSSKPSTFTLPTSNRSIDVVLHRSDVRFLDCGTLTVIQTYDASAKLIDAQAARGQALHCGVIQSTIEAGGRVGAAAVVRPATTRVNNAVSAAANASATAGASASATGGAGGEGGGGGGGNNGQGNGSEDGTNNGTDNHHDNGDNS